VVTYFNEVCTACEKDRLERCIRDNPVNRFFANVSADEWLDIRTLFADRVCRGDVRFIVPSPSVTNHWQRLIPGLPAERFHCIPHGLDYRPPTLPTPSMEGRLRLVVLGSLAPQKGRTLLEDILPRLVEQVDLVLLGCDEDGSQFGKRSGVTIIPSYQHDELHAHLARICPHLGLLLSVWPETFSYTLSELWLTGIPVLATRLGSFADRITPGLDGWLCDPTPEAILANVAAVDQDRTALARAWTHLRSFEHRRMAEMIGEYEALTPVPMLTHTRLFGSSVELPGPVKRQHQPLYVDTQASFPEVLQAFGYHAQTKLMASPRLRPWQRKALSRLLRLILGLGRVVARKPRIR
jgi:glycosyltransferase involved in cell wall biosynthesis